jgi:hypothetical protein
MEDIVRNDIISVLKDVLSILNEKNPGISELKALSNRTIHNASIYQDEHSISMAIFIYSLSKVMERTEDGFDFSKIKNIISLSITSLENNSIDRYDSLNKQLFSLISRADDKFRKYIQEVISQAQIRKGSKIYEHGISASKTAQILGISLWDLYRYLGATQNIDTEAEISSVRQRLKFTRSLFS